MRYTKQIHEEYHLILACVASLVRVIRNPHSECHNVLFVLGVQGNMLNHLSEY